MLRSSASSVGIAESRKQPREVWKRSRNGTSWHLKAFWKEFVEASERRSECRFSPQKATTFCEAIWMDAAFCEGSARGSALGVLDRANGEQGAADAQWQSKNKNDRPFRVGRMIFMVHPGGVEPSTFWSVARRSIQLSYGCSTLYNISVSSSFFKPPYDNNPNSLSVSRTGTDGELPADRAFCAP